MNELVEAADDKQLGKTIARYGRDDLLEIDELGYLELDRRGAEMRTTSAVTASEPCAGSGAAARDMPTVTRSYCGTPDPRSPLHTLHP